MQVTSFGFPFAPFPFAPDSGMPGAGFAQALDQLLAGPAPAMPASANDVPPPATAIELPGQPDPAAPAPAPQVPGTLAQLLTTAAPAAVPAVVVPEPVDAPAPSGKGAAPQGPVARPGKADAQPLHAPDGQAIALPAEAVAEAPAGLEAPAPTRPAAGPTPVSKAAAEPAEVAPAAPAEPANDAQPAIPVEILATVAAAAPRPAPAEPVRPAEPGGAVTAVGRKATAPRGVSADAPAPALGTDGTPAKPDARIAPVHGRPDSLGDGAARDEQPAQPFAARHEGLAAPAHAGAAPASAPATTPAQAPAPAHEPELAARPGHLGQALGVEIARKVELGEESLRIRLNPGELGRVEVTLAFDDGGSLRATVRAESAHALELLRQDMPDLARTLDQAGIRADAQSFRFESRTGGDGGATPQQQQQQRHGQHAAGNEEPETLQPAWHAVRGDGQVDLLA